jgi:hypothetical protein
VGRIPSRFNVTQFLSQWTPQLNRRFTIHHANEKSVEFDWNKFADTTVYRPDTVAGGVPRETLVKDVQQAFGSTAHAAVFIGGKRQDLLGNFGFLQSGQVYGLDEFGNQLTEQQRMQQQMARQANLQTANDPARQSTGFLEDVSVNRLGGLFDVVSQLSPTGGKDFEDMALVDPSDPDEWLLVVAVENGGDVDLYRKLYRQGD